VTNQVLDETRATWAAGDYESVAELIWEVGERIVRRVGIGPGERVLDVACGTGNAAIRAAEAGGRVVGLDATPELLERARALSGDVDWVEGDAEALPFADDEFDVVLSTFGCMFAPRHEAAAGEIARVLRPGGRFGICSWTPEGAVGDFFATVASHLPPSDAAPPVLWGTEEHVRELFPGADLVLERDVVDLRYPSVADAVDFYATKFGPLVKARERLEPQGGWQALLDDFAAMFERHMVARGDEVVYPAEYLVAVGRV
jgi:ubiquinone/menaquinone biosynthesis C-methylase UbiE